jgi:parallel beta-helix repeat protein
VLQNVEVRYAGNVANPGHTHEPYRVAAVQSRAGASPSFLNLRIRDSENIGMDIQNSSPRLEGVTIERSGRRAIQQSLLATPTYVSVAFHNNRQNHIGLEAGTVSANRSWDFLGLPVHVLGDALRIDTGTTLSLAAGTTLKFPTGGYFEAVGDLIATGTSANPIVFTSYEDDSIGGDSGGDGSATQAGPGQWEALYLRSSGSRLEYVDVRYAGNVASAGHTHEPYRVAAINVSSQSQPTIRNSRIVSSENVGMQLHDSSAPTLSNLRIEKSGREAIVQSLEANPVYAGIVFDNNRGNRITLKAGTITGQRSLDFQGLPVHLSSDLIVGANASLTLVPGTILKMPEGAYLQAVDTGTLIARGTAERPIVVTSIHDDSVGGDSNDNGTASLPRPGQWESIYLHSSSSLLENVEVRYAGNVSNPGHTHEPFRIASVIVDRESSPTIRNVRIRFGENQGLRLQANTKPLLDGLRIENSGREAIVQELSSEAVYRGVQFLDNGMDRISLIGGTIATTRTFDFERLPVFVTSNLTIAPSGNVTIAPGSIFKFTQGDFVLVQGTLDAQGTAAAPIIFTSLYDDSVGGDSDGTGNTTIPRPGQWESLYIDSSTTTLDHVEIRYAGNVSNPGHTHEPFRVAAMHIRNGSQPQITNTRIFFGENVGLRIQNAAKPRLNQLTIEFSGREAIEHELDTAPTYQDVTLHGNFANRITLQGGTIAGTRTFDFDDIPVFVASSLTLAAASSVTIVPGTILKFGHGQFLLSQGTLNAQGTAEKPIILTSIYDDSAGGDSNGDRNATTAVPGQWQGLYLDSNTTARHIDVRYAGNVSNPGHTHEPYRIPSVRIRNGAQVTLDQLRLIAAENEGILVQSGTLQLTNSEIIQAGRTAVDVASSATITNTLIQGAPLGVRVQAGASASGTNNAFVGLTNGIRNERNDATFAQFDGNWWGHSGGPHDSSNADGQTNINPLGTPVSDWVRYGAWRTTPPDPMALGPIVKSIQYAKLQPTNLQVVYVEFEQPILAASLSPTDVGISGPGFATVTAVERISATTYRIELRGPDNGQGGFLPLAHGSYQLTIGPNVLSLSNQAMDGNNNGTPGEPNDAFSGSILVDGSGPMVTSSSPAHNATLAHSFSSVDVTFHESIDPRQINLNGVRLLKVNESFRPALGATVLADNRVRFHFRTQSQNGSYAIVLEPWAVVDRDGNEMNQDGDNINGENEPPQFDGYRASFDLQRQSLKILSQVPATVTSEAIESIDVTFNQPISTNSFSPADVQLTGPVGLVPIVSVTRLSDTLFRIATQRATADGRYDLSIGPAITDIGGVPMDQDGDGNSGELDDRYRSSLLLAGGGPQILNMTPMSRTAGHVSAIEVQFSEPIQIASMTAIDVSIVGPSGVVPVTAIELVSPTVARVRFQPQTLEGNYDVHVGPNIADLAGTLMDQDRDGQSGELLQDVFVGGFAIDGTGLQIVAATPTGGTNAPFSSIELTFSEAFLSSSFTLADVNFQGPNGTIAISQIVFMDNHKARIHFPQQNAKGVYTLIIGPNIVDVVGNAMDSNRNGILGEASDAFTSTITLALPDLLVDSINAPSVVVNGQTFDVSYTIKNVQSGTATAPWNDRVVLSTDRFYGNNDDRVLETRNVTTSLGENQSYVRTFQATAPFGFTGEARIFVLTDSGSVLSESNEQNNRIETSLQINFQKPPSDLIVDAIATSGPAGRGTALPLTFRIRNDGTATTSENLWSDQVYLSQDVVLDGSDRLLGTLTRQGVLDSGASYTVAPSLVIPTNMPIGDYFVIVAADSSNQVDEPTAENNNVLASTNKVSVVAAPLPDLIIPSVALASGSTPRSGEPVTIEWTGKNAGNLVATGTWRDRVFLSNDGTLSANDLLLGDVEQSRELAPDANYSATITRKLPEGISGNHYLIVVPDATNTIAEGDGETTGTRTSDVIAIALYPYADLTVKSVTAPPLLIGDPVDLRVSWTVENVGAGPGRTSSWTDRVVLSRNGVLGDSDDLVVGQFTHDGAMPAGSAYERTQIVPLAARTNGRFTLFVQTDSHDEVFEPSGHQSNQNQPSHFVDITPTPYADLVVEAVTTSGTPLSGQPLSVSWTVANRGIATTDSSSWTDFLYVSSDPTGATGMRFIGQSTHGGALGVDQSYSRTTDVILPRDLNGIHYVFVKSSGPYEFLYNNAGNQKRSEAIDVVYVPPPPVDLRVTEVSLGGLTQIFDSSRIELRWTVRNDGPQATETGWIDRVSLLSVNDPNVVFSMGQFTTANPLEAGKTLTRTEVFMLPRTTGLFRFVVATVRCLRIKC